MMPRNRPKWGMCNPMTPVIITKLTPNQRVLRASRHVKALRSTRRTEDDPPPAKALISEATKLPWATKHLCGTEFIAKARFSDLVERKQHHRIPLKRATKEKMHRKAREEDAQTLSV